jgi:hypothetical protein
MLKKRLAALEPFVGKTIIAATFYFKPSLAALKINPETGKLIHSEVI